MFCSSLNQPDTVGLGKVKNLSGESEQWIEKQE